MSLKKGDFIEIEFTGRVKGEYVFDSNIKEDLKKINSKLEAKPLVFCLGHGMFLKGVEDFLIGKEVGSYEIELTPENAFGKRDRKLIHLIPMKVFRDNKLNPIVGASLNFDNMMGKILTVSGGRVVVDFNGPMAGKDVVYKIKVIKKVDDVNDKVKALTEFLFRKELKFKIDEGKVTLEVESDLAKFVELFKDKFKEMIGLDMAVEEIKKKSS